jgi:hypothetical protein
MGLNHNRILPPNEQALQARDCLLGEAADELEDVPDSRFDCANGIQLLLDDTHEPFCERDVFKPGGHIREYKSITRGNGESVHKFILRFRRFERKLRDAQVAAYPEQSRAIELLDGLRLDEKSMQSVLTAAGNKYDVKKLTDVLSVQHPSGVAVTGQPLRGKDQQGQQNRHGGKGARRGKQKYSSWNASGEYADGGDSWWHEGGYDDSFDYTIYAADGYVTVYDDSYGYEQECGSLALRP